MMQPTETDRPTVQLRHELPDGSWHIDWLLGTDQAGRQPLIAFRLPSSIDELAGNEELQAERIADHRPVYLSYEGPISGGRGSVKRLSRGRITAWRQTQDQWDLTVIWQGSAKGGRAQRLRLERADGALWILHVLT